MKLKIQYQISTRNVEDEAGTGGMNLETRHSLIPFLCWNTLHL
jgi:hypothetical protein